ncbi:acyltransferase [Methanobrevibacter sp.]|uniref:acyltransferase n=1 Tax=Methanobrevibacter sp. TaxID=66852 RepID=UPI00388DA1CC
MRITKGKELLKLKNNEFIGEVPKLTNSQININGKNNTLVCEENVTLWNSRIDFNGDNSILYLSSNTFDYAVNISFNGNNICFIGKDNFFNGISTIVLSESKNVMIGANCLFSYGIGFRVSDVHLIYHTKTKERMNYSKSIYIGDHVWLGQNAMILKGTQIGSGSIIGANSVLSNKIVPSNTTFAGSPARLTKEDTFWVGYSVHPWTEETTEEYSKYDSENFVYTPDDNSLDFEKIEFDLNNMKNHEDVIFYIASNFLETNKNRFSFK